MRDRSAHVARTDRRRQLELTAQLEHLPPHERFEAQIRLEALKLPRARLRLLRGGLHG